MRSTSDLYKYNLKNPVVGGGGWIARAADFYFLQQNPNFDVEGNH